MENLIHAELPLIAEEVCVFPVKSKAQYDLNNLHEINSDIVLLTSEIENKYPELYKYLDETPIVFNKDSDEEVTITELVNYLESLDIQLYNYFDTHELNVKSQDFVF